MRAQILYEEDGRRTLMVTFDIGEEFFGGLEQLASDLDVGSAAFTAIGAFRRATLGYFDWETKEYREIPVEEQVEVVSLTGNVAEDDGRPKIHAHAVVGTRNGTAICGHVMSGHVRPTLEVVIEELPAHLRRRHDAETGLALIPRAE